MPWDTNPPVTTQAALSVNISIPAGTDTMDLMELRVLATRVPVMALSASTGLVMLKLNGVPTCDIQNVAGAPRVAASTRRCWKNEQTPGLPLPVGESVATAVAAPAENTTVGVLL